MDHAYNKYNKCCHSQGDEFNFCPIWFEDLVTRDQQPTGQHYVKLAAPQPNLFWRQPKPAWKFYIPMKSQCIGSYLIHYKTI